MVQDAVAPVLPAAPIDSSLPRQKLKTFDSLQYRDFRLLWLGQIGASASQWMEQIARPLLILALTDSAIWVGLVAATRMLPMLIIGTWAGVVADRVDKRKILLSTQLVTLSMHLVTAALILTHTIEPWMVLVTSFVSGSSMAFNQPARQSLIPRMVPRESVGNAVALNSAAMNVMRIGGPSIAGLILAAFDFGDLYLIQAFMYLWVMLWTFQIGVRTSESGRPRKSFIADFKEGIAAIRGDKPILYILCLSLMLFIWGFPYQSVFVPLIATRVLDVGRTGTGVLVSLIGVGALCGSLTVATAGGSLGKRGVVMLVQVFIFCGALLIFSQAKSMYIVVPALIVSGAMQTSFMSLNNAFVLARTPPEIQGRIMSLFTLDRGLVPLGATIGGVLAATLGPQDGLTIMALICLGCTTAIAVLVPAVRRVS